MMVINFQSIKAKIFNEVSIIPLVAFRIIFGSLMLFGVIRFIAKSWVDELYIQPDFHFSYLGFDWVKVLPENWMYLPFILLIISSIGIIFGAFYRISALIFFLNFTYIELIDKSYYLNHYYFVSLIAALMCFLPAHADFSWDAKRNSKIRRNKVPFWCIGIIQLQLGIVYFFAGIAKLESDWLLEAQPLRIWLQAYRDLPLIGWLFASTTIAYFFSWFGCIYDLSIPFFLSNKKTRSIAYFFVIVFHILTWLLFPIGVFPWVMIFCTLIFFPASFHTLWINFLKKWFSWSNTTYNVNQFKLKKLNLTLLAFYLAFQFIFPLRYLAYPGELFWHEQGFRFSWRVMLMHKEGYANFYLKDRNTGGELEIDNTKYLSNTQLDQMSTQPDLILSYAHFLHKEFNDTTFQFEHQKINLQNPIVCASIFVSLNGRPSQAFVKKDKNLIEYNVNYQVIKWIEPFQDIAQ